MSNPRLAQVAPHDADAESNVLGAMLLAPSACSTAAELLSKDDFNFGSNAVLFEVMAEMDAAGTGVDVVTVTAELERRNLLHRVNGRERVRELAMIVPAASNVPHYCRIVKDTATLRRLLYTGQRIVKLAHDGDARVVDVADRVSEAEKMVAELNDLSLGGDAEPLSATIADVTEAIRQATQSNSPRSGVRTGFADLDAKTLGLHPGQLVIIAARPSMGKSVLGLNIAENVAATQGPSAFFSYEMPREELALRQVSRLTGISTTRLRQGVLKPPEWMKVESAAQAVSNLPLFVDDDASLQPAALRARIRRLKRRHDIRVVVVDYLQLVPVGGNAPRHEKVGEVSRALKLLARELEVPIVAVAQLNRASEGRENKRPQLSELRESGTIEQDADVALLLYRDEYYNPESPDKGIAELQIAKQRMGQVGVVKMRFVGRSSSFQDLARE